MVDILIEKLERRDRLSDAETDVLRALPPERRRVEAGFRTQRSGRRLDSSESCLRS
ncbi:hypothetical protein [Brevundimonas sp. A19_0]|uniref:hypothetical protein n=1 Tax=Brevundimonas sp. A19_0 TaxID=2821087 RepID=UPI001AD9E49C|nr:hypothetical protein [Brevundimonas sp. A19_0]MBO9501161.1 hypothetical protein [Brevundimonas sp. A19_0]